MLKRLFDILFSIILIILFAPVLIIVSLLILAAMGRPILFTQSRPGYKEKIFGIYKFRTMTNETDVNGELLPDSQRLQGLGKFIRSTSLDELPQLFNVLKGEMSFVGPRPLLVEYLPLYNERQKIRHDVKPGITGWAQINYRYGETFEDAVRKFEYDLYYIKYMSHSLNQYIIFATVKTMLLGRGAR